MTSPAAIRARWDAAPMSRTQTVTVVITFLLSALDGFDVLSVTFAAPAITADWGIGRAALGVVLSAGLVGMALGALLLAPLADLLGRKPVVLASLALMAAGMLLCALSGSLAALVLARVVAGLGIGTCVAVINPVAAEFANARRRALTVSIMAIGYPVGGVAGGLLAAWLLTRCDWPAIFLAGAVAALLLIPAVAAAMPESLAFLIGREGPAALPRLNAVLLRCNQPPLDTLPPRAAPPRRGYAAIFAPGQASATAWITVATVLFVMAVYYMLSWLPQMVADAGFAAAEASKASAIASLAGVTGGLALGWLAQAGGLRWLTTGAMLGLGAAIAAFGLSPASLPLLMTAAGIAGFFLFGGSAGAYATLATTFADEARAAGSGFVSGMGRIGSAAAPALAGWMFASGFGRAGVSLMFAGCATAAGLILFFGWRRFRSR